MTGADPLNSCASASRTRAERVLRGVVALVVAAFAISFADQWWIAVPAGLAATVIAVTAISGRCTSDLVRRRNEPVPEEAFGYPEAPTPIGVE
ncbi:hypothetical protein [Microbacterium immunditiarum]|uniref:Inner membrane protein YgaP-like transmembrane domain-containing protein n=1 Tax=Microbacterium immunditiarum TaxID=337480 RepID=A0A7Y9GSG0_9MICO|nr:hypothetical protein [Microbacterium immunditiarum]NYE21551.1 hypothetical protein [Microbacterium immunditiarum]